MLVTLNDLPIKTSYLLGYSQEHVTDLPNHSGVQMHIDVIEPLQQLIADAKRAGFDLRVASGFRDFDRQRFIWNRKCCGERPVYDRQGQELDVATMAAWDKVEAILHWSALPGGSRHHWGTECDIYDASVMLKDYQLQLHPDEYINGGLFEPMMVWLADYLQQEHTPNFYRPYYQQDDQNNDQKNDGVASEPWHLSYQPVAQQYERAMTVELLKEYLQALDSQQCLAEQETILDHISVIYQRFIQL